jgi:hypothetical protein
MHLVFATSLVPDGEPATGYELANAVILDALKRTGARITVVGFIWPGKQPADPDNTVVLGEIDVRTDAASAVQKLKWLAKAVREGLTFQAAKLRVLPVEQVRATLSRLGPIDGFVINAAPFAGAFEHVLRGVPSIYVAHNVEYRSAEENAAAASSTFERMLYRREAKLLKALEERLCDNANFVFTLSDEDRATLGLKSDARSVALPLVTRTMPPPAPTGRRIACDAALIGTWTWQPNRIGLDWFLGEVAPRLGKAFRVRIAGALPADLRAPGGNVEFVGRVRDATAFLRSGAVVPLISRAGTGVQLKTIETFENGLPSVATTRSIRGIDRVPENCVVADDPAIFAQALEEAAAAPVDLDGRDFHRTQLAALDRQIARGLAAIGFAAERVSA